uniref:PH domain-containing protein n=1 Tax=Strongyloides venezuelensis TaxID=75913 RepID=A0A0K0EWZ0_STRVS
MVITQQNMILRLTTSNIYQKEKNKLCIMYKINNNEKSYNVIEEKGRNSEKNNFDNNRTIICGGVEENLQSEKQNLQTEAQPKISKTCETIPRLHRKILTTKTPMIKKYWEKNIEKENLEKQKQIENMKEKKKSYEFPRWRSIDAMSASLVASSNQKSLIPNDSTIPDYRKQLIDNSERNAEIERSKIKIMNEKAKLLKKGKSMETLSVPPSSTPWYDREQIKESVSRESISDVSGTREKWKSGAVYNNKGHLRSNYNIPTSYMSSERSQSISNLAIKKVTNNQMLGKETFEVESKSSLPQSILLRDNIENNSSSTGNNVSDNTKNSTEINRNDFFIRQNEEPNISFSTSSNLTLEHYYFLKFLHEKRNLCHEFNIVIPNNVSHMMEEIVNSDRYCLVAKTDTYPMSKNNYVDRLTPSLSETSSFLDSSSKQGRFVKNQHSLNSSNNTLRYKRTSDCSQLQNIQTPESNIESLHSNLSNGHEFILSNVNYDKLQIHKNNFYGHNYYNI